MFLRTYTPGPPLDQYVDRFWFCSDTPAHPRERILPSGTVELVITANGVPTTITLEGVKETDKIVVKITIKGATATLDTDKILMSIGRRPNSENLGLDAAGVTIDSMIIQFC